MVGNDYREAASGDEENRTPDLGIANAALSQLSYVPAWLLLLTHMTAKAIQQKRYMTGMRAALKPCWGAGASGHVSSSGVYCGLFFFDKIVLAVAYFYALKKTASILLSIIVAK